MSQKKKELSVWVLFILSLLCGLIGCLSFAGVPFMGWFLLASIVFIQMFFAFLPGEIATNRNLSNASGIGILGLVGLLIPVCWIVALILALVGTSYNKN